MSYDRIITHIKEILKEKFFPVGDDVQMLIVKLPDHRPGLPEKEISF
jgi:hypothetical protein